MNIASSTWWMTTAFTFSQHAITTENKGAPPWNQVLLPHMSSGVLQSFREGTDVLDAHAAAPAGAHTSRSGRCAFSSPFRSAVQTPSANPAPACS